MSAIPKWMPGDEERIAAVRFQIFDGMYYRTGRRAQLAALEELIEGHEGSAMVDRAKAMIEEIGREIG